MAEVVRQLSERLAALGHSITVATGYHPARTESWVNGVNVVSFEVSGNSVYGLKGDVAGYERFLLDSRFDIVVNFAAQQWATDIALPLLPRVAGRKVFVPTGFSGLYSRKYREYFRQLPELMHQYDMNVFLSDCYRDICLARKHGIEKIVLIPNGASADEFLGPVTDIRSQLGILPNHFLVLHVGSHTGLKGHEETIEIFSQADIRDATLLIVGNEPPDGCGSLCREQAGQLNASARFLDAGKRIIVTTLTRPETVSAFHAAELFLFPSNIECSPIVLFECMASLTPFLATDAGNSAEIIEWSGGAGVLLPTAPSNFWPRHGSLIERFLEKVKIVLGRAEDFCVVHAEISKSALLLESLSRDGSRRKIMAQTGFSSWQERFTWEKISDEYEALYRCLLERTA